MNDRQQEVLRMLQQLQIDDPSGGRPDLTFVQRLARENRWNAGYAERVVDEYKRFVFLACFAGHPVTPSDQVDQAWHLHMTYTRSYWNRLCTEILGRPLHHDPTRGGDREDAKFDDWYARTKGSYFIAFGEEPPSDIWPSSAERFDRRQRWVRVNAARLLLFPRPSQARLAKAAALALAGIATLAAAGCSAGAWSSNPLLVVPITLFAVVVLVALARRATRGGRRESDRSSSGHGCGGSFWGCGGCGSSGGGGGDSSGCSGGGGCGGGGCGGGGCGGGCGGE